MHTIDNLAAGWMTPKDLQKRYGISISVQSILRMKKRQTSDKYPLPFTKIGKRIIYNENQINEWLIKKQEANALIGAK